MLQNTALITDGLWRKALATARALSQAGVKVSVGERTWVALTHFSRYPYRKYKYPSVTLHPDQFLDWLEAELKTRRYDVLITPEEETCLLVSQHLDRIEPYVRFVMPAVSSFALARNKHRLLTHAQGLGITCPRMKLIRTSEDFQSGIDAISFPLVLKPVFSTGGQGIHYLLDRAALNGQFMKMKESCDEFLMQEFIPGYDYYGVSVIFNRKNQMRSAFVHKKIRQYPMTGGVSTCAVSVEYPELVNIAETLLKDIQWYGAANVEFKVDARTGVPCLMEVNPRLWGSIQLAISSGINVPYLLYRLAIDGDIPPTFSYKTGVRFRNLFPGDWMNFYSNLLQGKPFDFDIFRLFERNASHAIWSLSDPLPSIFQILSLVDYMTSKELKRFHE